MKEWAEIYQVKVRSIHEMPDDLTPVFNPNSFMIAVEITNLNPKPAVGWKYDIQTGEFSEPPYIPPVKTGKDKAKDVLKGVDISNLESTDRDLAIKAILQALDLI